MRLNELTALWDGHIRDWMNGEASSDSRLLRWQETYRGKGEGAVDFAAMPEPWIGDPSAAPGVVLMGMNPGSVNKEFQHRGGIFPNEIDDLYGGSWANWAKSSPYLRDPWRSANKRPPPAWAIPPWSARTRPQYLLAQGEFLCGSVGRPADLRCGDGLFRALPVALTEVAVDKVQAG